MVARSAAVLARILVVEDDPLFMSRLGRLLRSAGYDVIKAIDAEEAVSILSRQQSTISLAVIDLVLPHDVSGLDIILALSRSKGSTKILAISGRLKPNQLETLKYAGADAVLQKPAPAEPLPEAAWLQCVQSLLPSREVRVGR